MTSIWGHDFDVCSFKIHLTVIQGLSVLTLTVIWLFRESCIHMHVKVLLDDGEGIRIQSHDHQGYGILQE